MKTEKPVLQVLQEARALILDPENWCQGRFTDYDGRICASKAIRIADASPFLKTPAYETLARVMGELDGGSYIPVCMFNDKYTHAHVIAAFDLAIAAEGKKQ